MRVAAIQQFVGPDKVANVRNGLANIRRAADQGASLACFAELAFERFHPQARSTGKNLALAEPIPGPTTEAFQEVAARLGIVVVINLYERCGEKLYDSSPVIDSDGSLLGKARMVHITDYETFHERDYYEPGDLGAPVFETTAGRVGIAICYDRHFPEYLRALALKGADLVAIPQAGIVDEWPEGLYEAEMRVASFTNGFFTLLANRVGRDGLLEFAGESFACSPDGSVIGRAPRGEEAVLCCDIDLDLVKESHARKLFLPDRRPDIYTAWI
jgi:beta-ureidopropionase